MKLQRVQELDLTEEIKEGIREWYHNQNPPEKAHKNANLLSVDELTFGYTRRKNEFESYRVYCQKWRNDQYCW